ncbi:putative transmembrane protein [Gregarina niphandrodes]|uniref:Transmembrane protein n=1 Tax=Gregarina niphandrodes TaxID=110365 RepID=A0A023BDJ5_GRENI|nr:putative transmembrane protein [Gregarina niphandrodes]EZG89014.1 putative transmembrane protein [Gregarina niphandrodes]|eukprot:XP_011128521.1 putative transmembrane protein [Gregarina niphandrodes]
MWDGGWEESFSVPVGVGQSTDRYQTEPELTFTVPNKLPTAPTEIPEPQVIYEPRTPRVMSPQELDRLHLLRMKQALADRPPAPRPTVSTYRARGRGGPCLAPSFGAGCTPCSCEDTLVIDQDVADNQWNVLGWSVATAGLIVGFILGYHRHEQNRRRRARIDSIDYVSSDTEYDNDDLTSYGS